MLRSLGRRTGAALLASSVLMGACGGGDAKGSASPPGSEGHTGTTIGDATTGATVDPSLAPWADGPDACLLLATQEVAWVLGFPVEADRTSIASDTGDSAKSHGLCTWRNPAFGFTGGYVTLSVAAPGTLHVPPAVDERVEVVDGFGTAAWLVDSGQGLGEGPNTAVVDMGDGGFVMNVYAYQDLTRDDLLSLAERAAIRWQTDREGDIPVQGTTQGPPAEGSR